MSSLIAAILIRVSIVGAVIYPLIEIIARISERPVFFVLVRRGCRAWISTRWPLQKDLVFETSLDCFPADGVILATGDPSIYESEVKYPEGLPSIYN